MSEIKEERNHWRDLGLARRLSKWGFDYPPLDLDFLFLEHSNGKAHAIIEYKSEHSKKKYASSPVYQALINLGDRAGIPVISCRYSDDYSRYKAIALNVYARNYIHEPKELSEAEWVALLYEIKGQEVSKEFLASMNIVI